MNDFRDQLRSFLIWLIMDPIVMIPVALAVSAAVLFLIVIVTIKRRDKSGIVKPGTRAMDLARTGAIPGVQWPEPIVGPGPSMIVEPRTRENMHPRVRMIFVDTGHGHMSTNGPDRMTLGDFDRGTDVTPCVSSVSTGGDTQPIEVAHGEASEGRSEREDPTGGDPDRRSSEPRGSRSRRRADRSRDRRAHRPKQS